MLNDATKERIDADIASEDVVLYMKGTPVFPQCGFSAARCWRTDPSRRALPRHQCTGR